MCLKPAEKFGSLVRSTLTCPSWAVTTQELQTVSWHFLQKNSSSFFSWPGRGQNAGRFKTFSMSWYSNSLSARTRWSLFARIILWPMIHSSHQNEQHWKQLKLSTLRLSQFPHLTPVESHSLMANTSSKLLIRKLVGRSISFPPGTWLSLRHSGHIMTSWRPLVLWIPSKQWRQKLCKHGSCFGSVNVTIHTEQDTSSLRLASKVLMSMIKGLIRFLLHVSNTRKKDCKVVTRLKCY